MNVYGKSDIGLIRKTNQDDIKYKIINNETLWAVVCDGMGGANGGDVASSIAADKISEEFDRSLQEGIFEGNIKSIMISSVIKASELIYETAQKKSEYRGMGTTVVVAVLQKGTVHIVSVGDSRAYIISDSGINQITVDHSIVQEMINKGEITREQAIFHPQKNIITRALGIRGNVLPDYVSCDLAIGDRVLLCTDGLTNELSDDEIYQITVSSSPDEIPDRLICEANNRRGADNTTVAVII